jgi:anaerobic selenocysteine-containing dehydrogenase
MGLVQRDGINRLRHAKRYSGEFDTICTGSAWPGFIAGTGRLAGPDPREMARSDLIVIWGTNAVATQVNVMTHAVRARKERGARIAVVDVYRNETMKQADIAICLKPGTDGAFACAVMHILFRDGHADRDYLEQYTDAPLAFEAHLRDKTPAWAAAITGLSIAEIEAFAKAVGETRRTFFRLGYGFSRSRNGAVNRPTSMPSKIFRNSAGMSAELRVTWSRTATSLSARAKAIPSSQPWKRPRSASASRLRPSMKASGEPGGTMTRIGRRV